jgi:hypothetical protein
VQKSRQKWPKTGSEARAGNNKFSLRSMSARESKLLLSIADFIRVILKFITVNIDRTVKLFQALSEAIEKHYLRMRLFCVNKRTYFHHNGRTRKKIK